MEEDPKAEKDVHQESKKFKLLGNKEGTFVVNEDNSKNIEDVNSKTSFDMKKNISSKKSQKKRRRTSDQRLKYMKEYMRKIRNKENVSNNDTEPETNAVDAYTWKKEEKERKKSRYHADIILRMNKINKVKERNKYISDMDFKVKHCVTMP